MAEASYNHNAISFNLSGLLYNTILQSNCQAFINDMKVRVKAANLFTYPDLAVICGEPEFYQERTDTITNPVVLFEILSNSTKRHDMYDKLEQYRSLPNVQNYVLIDQKRVLVRNYQRLENGKWLVSLYSNLEDELDLPVVGAKLGLAQIYNRVRFKQKQV